MDHGVYAFASLNLDHCTVQDRALFTLAARAFKIARFKALLPHRRYALNLAMPVALLGGWRMADGAGGRRRRASVLGRQ
jgi:hypothetical protein